MDYKHVIALQLLHIKMTSCQLRMLTELYECVIAVNRMENSERRMLKLKKLLHELPEHNFETFRFLAQHLNKVATREEQNKVGASIIRPYSVMLLCLSFSFHAVCNFTAVLEVFF